MRVAEKAHGERSDRLESAVDAVVAEARQTGCWSGVERMAAAGEALGQQHVAKRA